LGLVLATAVAAPQAAAASNRNASKARGYIVVYRASVTSVNAETESRERVRGFSSRLRFRSALEGFSARLKPSQVRGLRADPEVDFVSPDLRVRAASAVPLASGEPLPPTGVQRIGAATATTTRQASTANVAVLDTGIDFAHPDLNAVSGKNCIGSGSAADDQGHGTHVAGTIGARNNGAGVVGVVPGTKLYAVKVLNSSGSGLWSQVICGIDWATATRADSDPANDVRVVNMSLSGGGGPVKSCSTTTDALHKAICKSLTAGITYVVAAGNSAWDFDDAANPDVPAAYPEVLTVTAMSDSDGVPGGTGGSPTCTSGQSDDRAATFSNYALTSAGRAHTIAAPGVCINSTVRGGGYARWNGTSMATPHVAGLVALCLGEGSTAGPCASLTPAQTISRIRADAEARTLANSGYGFLGDPSRPLSGNYFGYLSWVGGPAPPAPKYYRPAGYGLASGTVYSGWGATSRLYENDGSWLEINAAKSGSTYVAEIKPTVTIPAADRASLSKLTIDYDGNASATNAQITVSIYNRATSAWETLFAPFSSTSDRSFVWSASVSPDRYLRSDGQVMLKVRGTGSSAFRTRTDWIRFTVE
jgi:subtilisin